MADPHEQAVWRTVRNCGRRSWETPLPRLTRISAVLKPENYSTKITRGAFYQNRPLSDDDHALLRSFKTAGADIRSGTRAEDLRAFRPTERSRLAGLPPDALPRRADRAAANFTACSGATWPRRARTLAPFDPSPQPLQACGGSTRPEPRACRG